MSDLRIDPEKWAAAYNEGMPRHVAHVVSDGARTVAALELLSHLPPEEQETAVQCLVVAAVHHCIAMEEHWSDSRVRAPVEKWLQRAHDVKENGDD